MFFTPSVKSAPMRLDTIFGVHVDIYTIGIGPIIVTRVVGVITVGGSCRSRI